MNVGCQWWSGVSLGRLQNQEGGVEKLSIRPDVLGD